MYSCAEGSWKYRKRIFKLLRFCVSIVAASLGWLGTLLLWNSFTCNASDTTKLIFLSVVAILVGVVTFFLPEKLKDFPYKERKTTIGDDLNKWLSKNDSVDEDPKQS